nr:PREDICTED: zinc finger protein 37-like [Megachile rotundata]
MESFCKVRWIQQNRFHETVTLLLSAISAQNSKRQLLSSHGNRKNKMPRKIERDDALERKKVNSDATLNSWHITSTPSDPLKIEENTAVPVERDTNPFEAILLPIHIKDEPVSNEFAVDQEAEEKQKPKRPQQKKKTKTQKEEVSEKDTQKEETDEILENLRNICPVCQKNFDNEEQMRRHLRKIHVKSFVCSKCNKGYYSNVALKEHEKSHEDDSYLECDICHMRFKRKPGLKLHHLRVHSGLEAKFTCNYCQKQYKLKHELTIHVKRNHTDTGETSICKYCGRTVKDVEEHERRHEKRARRLTFQYHCNLCDKRFKNSIKLDNHLLLHKEGFKCTECDERFSHPADRDKHKELKHKLRISCTFCTKKFNSRSNFYTHVLTHAGVKPYKCDICDETFTQRNSMLKHRKKSHPESNLPAVTVPMKIAEIAKKILQKEYQFQDSE